MNLDNNPNYLKAVEFIAETDLGELELGKHFIDGDNLFVNIVDSQMKTPEQARLEVHDKYIDIQVPLDKEESFGVKPRRECVDPDGEFNEEKDILFYKDKDWTTVTIKPGEAITFDTDTAHAPLIGEGTIHKAIFKVKVL
ncbi:MAG: YhcH/YjgK/YiaL family protein [Bacteroidales bacterium]|nr:YhcH/YjgK/YiaL family protein [Bacteroidales bacterium]